jgi:hypothetical protein
MEKKMSYDKYEPLWAEAIQRISGDGRIERLIIEHVEKVEPGFDGTLFRATFLRSDRTITDELQSPREFSSSVGGASIYFAGADLPGLFVKLVPNRPLTLIGVRHNALAKFLEQTIDASGHAIQHGLVPRLIQRYAEQPFDAIHEVGEGYEPGAEILVVRPSDFVDDTWIAPLSIEEARAAAVDRTVPAALRFSRLTETF